MKIKKCIKLLTVIIIMSKSRNVYHVIKSKKTIIAHTFSNLWALECTVVLSSEINFAKWFSLKQEN